MLVHDCFRPYCRSFLIGHEVECFRLPFVGEDEIEESIHLRLVLGLRHLSDGLAFILLERGVHYGCDHDSAPAAAIQIKVLPIAMVF